MLPYLWMLTGAAAFTVMSELAHALNHDCHWTVVALARTSLAFVFTFSLAKSRGIPLVFWRPGTLWLRSIFGSISLMCTFYAFKNLPASDVVVITNMFPIWVAILSWPILGERPSFEVWPAVLCSVAGAALINFGEQGAAVPGADRIGGLVTAGVSSVLSAGVVIGLNLLQRIPSQTIVVHFSGVATCFCLALMTTAGTRQEHFTSLAPTTWLLLIALGLSASVGQIFLTKAFAAGPASRVAVVALSQVVFCYVFELCFLGRAFQWNSLAGMMLIIVPTAWMLLRGEVSRAARVPPGPADVME